MKYKRTFVHLSNKHRIIHCLKVLKPLLIFFQNLIKYFEKPRLTVMWNDGISYSIVRLIKIWLLRSDLLFFLLQMGCVNRLLGTKWSWNENSLLRFGHWKSNQIIDRHFALLRLPCVQYCFNERWTNVMPPNIEKKN